MHSETAPQMGTLEATETAFPGLDHVVEQTDQKENQTVLHTGRCRMAAKHKKHGKLLL
jgi:hypothetical protein